LGLSSGGLGTQMVLIVHRGLPAHQAPFLIQEAYALFSAIAFMHFFGLEGKVLSKPNQNDGDCGKVIAERMRGNVLCYKSGTQAQIPKETDVSKETKPSKNG
jgi:hypothetical protein